MLLVLYNLLFPFALLATFPFYLRRMLKRGNYARNFGQRFGLYSRRLKARLAKGKWTWIRARLNGQIFAERARHCNNAGAIFLEP